MVSNFRGKTLLITGGTGSFGNAVLGGFLDSPLEEIRILSRDEKKQEDLRNKFRHSKIKFYLGDVRDRDCLKDATRDVHYVFHAAALKQVPSCEFHPMEAVKTNVIGTENVLEASIANGVERVVCLSTDKAVYPINAMGCSKAMMEKIMVAKSRQLRAGQTVICGTRYGNVMASRGSVLPLFAEQILAGRPLTITDPNMTRFMMSLKDAVDLVMFAFEHGCNGDIFVQKAPAATIQTVAQGLLKFFGKPHHPIEVIGTRHGEKLYETLLSREEMVRADDIGEYFRIPADLRDLNYGKFTDYGKLNISLAEDYTSHNTKRLSVEEFGALLRKLDYFREYQESYRIDAVA